MHLRKYKTFFIRALTGENGESSNESSRLLRAGNSLES